MSDATTRRFLLTAPLAAVPVFGIFPSLAGNRRNAAMQALLPELEAQVQGRLGFAMLDFSSGRRESYRPNERFPMCSTFKLPLVARVLANADAGHDSLDRRIVLTENDFVSHAPVTRHHLGRPGMTLRDLCEAAIKFSDGTAANVLLANVGGPAGLTAWLRTMGDAATRLDRIEMDLNEASPGDPRDTTTPASMLEDVRKILFTDMLSAESRAMLAGWMIAERIGVKRLRRGFPENWTMGDKPGTGDNGTVNDIAVIWPPGGAPLIIAAYLTQSRASLPECETVLAQLGRFLAAGL